MDYPIKTIDIASSALLPKVNSLLRETFGSDIDEGRLLLTTRTNSGSESLYLAAFDGDEVVGFNAFISHDLQLNGSEINCYQCCWIATKKEYRGRDVFWNLVETAKRLLAERGAAFIFCFPNSNSRPIFIGRLGFREVPSLKWQVPNIPIVRDLYVRSPRTDMAKLSKMSIMQNGRQLIDLKRKQYKDELLICERDKSFIWGVERKKRKYGINVKYFEIGGMFFDQVDDAHHLFRDLCRKVGKVQYFQLTTSEGSSYNTFLHNLKPAQTNDLIIYDLNLNTSDGIRFNFFGGVKDVF